MYRYQHGLILSIFLSFFGSSSAQGPVQQLDDNDILEAVETELRLDDVVPTDNLDVSVNRGVVTVSGQAFTLLQKRRIVPLIESLQGVRAIVNRVRVRPNTVQADEQIAADVQAILRDDPVADEEEIVVSVDGGQVTLEGSVDSFPEKWLTEMAVAGVLGVRDVDNRITINVKTKRPDDEIKPEILRRFEWSPYVDEGLIEMTVKDGIVTLRGVVGSAHEKSIASVLAWVAGVRNVDANGLNVQPRLDKERRRDKFTVLRDDIQLQRAVEDALLYDPRLRGTKITVRVRHAAVSLLGNVSTLAAKRAAETDAKNTLGVRRVVNHLKVKIPDWPGDSVVTERAQQALARDAHLSGFDLRASSHFGKVYISGEVNTHFEKHRAEVVVANVTGVLDVINRVAADAPWKPKADDEIQEDVQRRLRWNSLLDENQIVVVVEDGAVTLRGTVDTWHERQAAGEYAYRGGAKRVINELDVRSRRSTPAGLKATLVPNQVEYELDAQYSGEGFRKFLEKAKQKRRPKGLPPAPEVDLVLRLSNDGRKPISLRLGHDQGALELSLTGKGAVQVPLGRPFFADFRPGSVVTMMPGEQLDIPVRSLQYGFRNASERWYWTQSGEYMLQATITWPADASGFFMQELAATPVKLNVEVRQGDDRQQSIEEG